MDQNRREPLRTDGSRRAPLRTARMGRRGRGVVADRRIEPGELVERSPVLVIPHADRAAIALGFTSLLNHSYAPNCASVRHIDDLAIDLVAARAIEAGEELTIDYQMTLWFTPE